MQPVNISELAKIHGVENLRFFFPASPLQVCGPIAFTSSEDEQTVIESKAVERFNRYVVDRYKMILQPLDVKYAGSDFYIRDFESLCEEIPDSFYIMVGKEKITS
jgi:hypothetical protein